MRVRIDYFKASGKFYIDTECDVSDDMEPWEVTDMFRAGIDGDGDLPGLAKGVGEPEFYMYYQYMLDDADWSYPTLIIPSKWSHK